MATVSFSGHRLALLAAYQEVIQEDCPADWALYTYEDDSDDLKLAASGGGGLQELSGHFENQKVMYGFCSVKDSQAALPKYVLINWVGEDVPDARKCACASHVAKVAEFFQGVDVIVNASSVEDIDAGAIGQRLSNGLARLSSPVLHRLRLREDENAEPVGTTYQKTDAAVEMKRLNREQFWEQAKREEELRKEEERKKALDERLKFEQERMEQERLEQEEREKRYREREQQIEEHRRKQQTLEAEEAKQRLKEQSIFGDHREEEEEAQMKKSESEVEEAAAIIAQRPDNPREFFKQQERVASASGCEMPTPFNHRPGSQMDSHRRAIAAAARSPSDSSSASTPVADQIERALDEVTSSQPQPLSREPIVESLLEKEPPGETAGPLEDLVFLETKEKVGAADSAAPVASAESSEEAELAEPAGPPEAPTQGSLIDLWQSDGVAPPDPEEWELQADLRAPTPPREEPGATLEESELVAPPEPPPLGEGAPEPPVLPADNSANLLNFDELPEPPATFCDPEEGDREAPDMGGMEGSLPGSEQDVLVPETLPMDLEELEPEQEAHLLTNGETTQKEGTQASEGYFSQSQDEEFAQSEELSAKAPPPVFYNKPPEIDITCWDADPVPEEEEAFGGSV